jgi:deoxyadenosine/deoxycytidine kinase
MAVISIVGTSGVGKSFLVQQLAALENLPAFFEGEEGVLPPEILERIHSKEDFVGCFQWFVDRCKQRFTRAQVISQHGLDCYMDGAVMTNDAVLATEAAELQPQLRRIVDEIRHLESDKIVLLIASKEAIRSYIAKRARTSEQNDAALTRAMNVQDAYLRLAEGRDDVIIIDRTQLEFTRREDLLVIQKRIRESTPLTSSSLP